MELKKVLPEEFNNKMLRNNSEYKIDYYTYFEPYIHQAYHFAIGPFFWFIPDQKTMTIVAVSKNAKQLTPYSQNEWLGKGTDFWAANIHEDDRHYVLAASMLSAEITESSGKEKSDKIRINIYCRMLNTHGQYRWVLIQFPNRYFNEQNQISSTWIMITDISHLKADFKCMMTLIDTSNIEHQFFKASVLSKEISALDIPKITKREQEVLQLMARGLNTPQIAKALFLSYLTVEKHKRNLRLKTNTKTSVELMSFVCNNNLF